MTDIEIPLGKRTKMYRLFEMLPALSSYTMLLAPFVLSFISPILAAIFVLVYIISYFVKSVALAVRTVAGYNLLRRSEKLDWAKRCADLENPEIALKKPQLSKVHTTNLKQLAMTANHVKPSDIYNVVIIATYNESREVLEPTIQSLLNSDYDLKRLIVVVAYEERGGENVAKTTHDLVKQYGNHFFTMKAIMHPADIPNEVPGKGANITFAARQIVPLLQKKSLDPENVIVTTLDSDNRPHRSYFSYLTYEYILHPDPRHTAFQPMTLFLNNIWDVPAPMRVVATGNSFWNLVVSQRPHLLRNFASHSQSMAALIDMDFWSVRTIVEDGHQFWRSYFRYNGNYSVTPLYIPIYQDAVLSETYRKTLIAQFVQVRRWAYGASDIAYVATRFFRKDRSVPFWDGLVKFFFLYEGHVSWASAALIITFGAFGPLLINPEAARSVTAHQLPEIVSNIQRIAMIGLFVSIFISFKMLPPRPARYRRHRTIWLVIQWVLMPVTSIIYGASAALNSQTRLLFGKYLERFDVTDKAVVDDKGNVSL